MAFAFGPPDLVAIRKELQRLTQEQAGALENAVYGAMTPQEVNEYDERTAKIRWLITQLNVLDTNAT